MDRSLIIIISLVVILLSVFVIASDKGVAAQTQYFVIGSEAFVPKSNVDYSNYTCGAYLDSGNNSLVAPVHLPQGAEIQEFKVFFNDTSVQDMTVILERQILTGCSSVMLSFVISDGTHGYYYINDTTISSPIVDNSQYSYLVTANSSNWDSNLRIKGVVITYTTDNQWDADGSNTVNLADAINALQVVAGQ